MGSNPLNNLPYTPFDLLAPVYSKSARNKPARYILFNIRPLGELVDMYHTRRATNHHDKVYALLGMSSDNPGTAELLANYKTLWEEIFRKLIRFCLSDEMSASVWDNRAVAVIQGKGRIIGKVSLVQRNDARGDIQNIGIAWKNTLGHLDRKGGDNSLFRLQVSAKPICVGDAVCVYKGHRNLQSSGRITTIRQSS